jgi:cyclophilin family peptidyl-prolyl cis-trans isomerase
MTFNQRYIQNLFSLFCFCILCACTTEQPIPAYKQELLVLEHSRNTNPAAFKPYLESSDSLHVINALDAMMKIQDTVFVQTFSNYLESRNKQIRLKSIEALGQTFHHSAFTPLKNHLKIISDSLENARTVESIMKVFQASDLAFIKKILSQGLYHDLGYALAASFRRVPTVSTLSSDILNSWRAIPEQHKAGYLAFLTRLNAKEIKPFQHILISEFLLKKKDPSIKAAIYMADILRSLNKLDFNRQLFLKRHFNPDMNWRIVQQFIYLMSTDNHNHSEYILGLLTDQNLHPYIKHQILLLLGQLRVDQSVYSYLLLNPSVDHYAALANKYPDQTVRFFNQNFEALSAFEQTQLVHAIFKTKRRSAVFQLMSFYPQLPLATQTVIVEKACKTDIFPDSLYLKILKENDVAKTSFIAQYALEKKRINFVEPLLTSFTQFSEASELETMLEIVKTANGLTPEKTKQWALTYIDSVQTPTLKSQLAKIGSIPSYDQGRLPEIPIQTILQNKQHRLEIVLNRGRIQIELDIKRAPIATYTLVSLAKQGFYNDLLFHRVLPNFVAQAGDPRGDGWGGASHSIPCEYSREPFTYGTVGIATSGKDTGSSQFFIMQSYAPHLNGKYTNIGKVISGFDHLEKIEAGEKIYSINVL